MIREVKTSDYKEIYSLSCQLGYKLPIEKVKSNILSILKEGIDKIFVETSTENKVIAYIHISPYKTLFFKPLVNILGIVVDNKYKRQGIGKRLIQVSEEWAKSNNIDGIRLVSSEDRKDAHIFYESTGFEYIKNQRNYRKIFNK